MDDYIVIMVNSSNDDGKPLDPTSDFQSQINDPTGLTGITDTEGGNLNDIDEIVQRDINSDDPKGMVSPNLQDTGSINNVDVEDVEILDDTDASLSQPHPAPNVVGESSISGSTPDPESDDDVLEAAHEVGLRLDESDEERKPLNIAEDVAAAERARRSPPLDQENTDNS